MLRTIADGEEGPRRDFLRKLKRGDGRLPETANSSPVDADALPSPACSNGSGRSPLPATVTGWQPDTRQSEWEMGHELP